MLKLEIISYSVIISWRILVSFRGFFQRLYFCRVKYLSFHNSSFALRLTFNCKWQGHSVTHPLFIYGCVRIFENFLSSNQAFPHGFEWGCGKEMYALGFLLLNLWSINRFKIKIIYFYYIAMKIHVLVCTNIYSSIYFLGIIFISQPSSYHEFYIFTKYVKTFEN